MESETQYNKTTEGGMESRGSDVKVANTTSVSSLDFLLRLLALATTLTAAIVLGVAKETQMVPFIIPPNQSVTIRVIAKWQYSSAFVYLMVSNAIACAYSAFSLVLSFAKPAGKTGLAFMVTILDLIMVALLFSGNGAASAIGVVGYKGNSHLHWGKVCDVFGKYCRQITASILVSLLGSIVFFILVVLATFNLRKKSP